MKITKFKIDSMHINVVSLSHIYGDHTERKADMERKFP